MEPVQPLTIDAPPEVADVIAGLGRCEDAVFSPDGRRLAVAGFGTDTLVVLEVDVIGGTTGAAPRIAVSGCTMMRCDAFAEPHGVTFADDLVLVGNRKAGLTAIRLPAPAVGVTQSVVEPVLSFDRSSRVPVVWPGSLCATPLAQGLFEVVVCNNYWHRITRHIIDTRRRRSLRDEVLLASQRLDVPDGISLSHDGRWMAISNHHTHTVLMYDRTAIPDVTAEPAATLHGVRHGHGLCFTPDDSALLVANSDSPFVTVFERGRKWSGDRTPEANVRVMSPELFEQCNRERGDGGTKGLDIHPEGLVTVLAAEARPLAFFETSQLLGRPTRSQRAPRPHVPASDATRRVLTDEIALTRRLTRRLEQRQSEVEALRAQLRERDEKIELLELWLEALRARSATPPTD